MTTPPKPAGVLLPLLVEQALRQLEKKSPDAAARVREHMEALTTGAAPGRAVRLFPSAKAYVAQSAARGATLTAGENHATLCCRGCGRGVLVLLLDGCPVAFYEECQEHAAKAGLGPSVATMSVASY